MKRSTRGGGRKPRTSQPQSRPCADPGAERNYCTNHVRTDRSVQRPRLTRRFGFEPAHFKADSDRLSPTVHGQRPSTVAATEESCCTIADAFQPTITSIISGVQAAPRLKTGSWPRPRKNHACSRRGTARSACGAPCREFTDVHAGVPSIRPTRASRGFGSICPMTGFKSRILGHGAPPSCRPAGGSRVFPGSGRRKGVPRSGTCGRERIGQALHRLCGPCAFWTCGGCSVLGLK